MIRTRLTLFPMAAVLMAGVVLAGCGSSGSKASVHTGAQAPTGTPAVSGPLGTKPTIAKPTGTAPTTLVVHDVAVGSGAAAQAGDKLSVQYDGILYSTGEQFDASWDDGNGPFSFTLGQGMVIAGWDQGLVGMKVGGRRELVIPPSLGYGSQANSAIPANSTLVFVVDLVSVTPGG